MEASVLHLGFQAAGFAVSSRPGVDVIVSAGPTVGRSSEVMISSTVCRAGSLGEFPNQASFKTKKEDGTGKKRSARASPLAMIAKPDGSDAYCSGLSR